MKLGFTEFSYGYAFTENLIRSSATGPTSAPVFPNLVQEAQLGYDVRIDAPGAPLFFQFKLPELMVRNSAKELSMPGVIGLSVPFFRMPLMRRDLSSQHQHLITLETRFPGRVLYASPILDSAAAFNRSYASASVHLTSALFSPTDIGPLPDDENHVVSYMASSAVAWRCSQPKKVPARKFENLAEEIDGLLLERSTQTLEDTIRELQEGVGRLIPAELRQAEGQIRDRINARRVVVDGRGRDGRAQRLTTELLVMRELVRVGLGVDLLVAQPRDPKKAKKKP